jgi:hypothetical protein
MTTLQEKRHRETINSIARTVAQRDACLANLVRYEVRLKSLRKLEARQAKAVAKPKPEAKPAKAELPMAQPMPAEMLAAVTEAIGHAPVNAAIDAIPAFLDRSTPEWKKTDAEAKKKVEEEVAERKRVRAKALAEKRKAAAGGDLKKMPLSGKAAIAHIRGAR